MTRNLNNMMMRFLTVIMLIIFSMGAKADVKVEIGKFNGGTIVEKSQTKPDANGLVTVTITVTPDKGFTIKQSDIVVVSTYAPDASGTRSPKIAAELTLLGTDPKDLSEPRDYTFIVGSSLGAWIKEANFHSDGAKGGGNRGTLTSLSNIADNPTGDYVINADIDASGFTTSIASFSGTLEAAINPNTNMPYRIKKLKAPLFTTLTGTVKNLVFEDVDITSGDDNGNTGAIACNMIGTSSNKAAIYNCGILSGSVSGSGNVGGLVGQLGQGTPASNTAEKNNCYARVINCYSFADIEGGSVRAGIVGYNSFSSTYNDQRTMVMNCMFYGDIDDTDTNLYPIYGGLDISNNSTSQLNNYNYYLYEAPYSKNKKIVSTSYTEQHYNHALAAEEKYLNRFEFYRNLLNSTRELAAWYATGNPADGNSASATNKMLKWVLDKSIAPYPILKVQGTYPSVINYDPVYTNDKTGKKIERTSTTLERNQGKKLGTLSVTISMPDTQTGGQGKPEDASLSTTSLTLQRTDKDYNNFNFNYDKVQLPYYNQVGSGNCTHNKVVTGWMITEITEISGDPYTASHYTGTNYDAPYYNFADRASSNKDLYSVSGRVFSQGAYFDVPDGVSSITIEPYWGNAAYLSDEYYDCYCAGNGLSGNNARYNCSGVNITGSKHYPDGKITIGGSEQDVSTDFSTALGKLSRTADTNVYDNAVVLVGNFHQNATPSADDLAYTIMSADLNSDNEPDYSLIFRSSKQQEISPIRFDFINVPGMAMAHKIYNTDNKQSNEDMAVAGNMKGHGWFEVTNTSLIRFPQFEYDSEKKTLNEPLILLGGIFEQLVSTNGTEGSTTHTLYIHLGSNVYFPVMFSNGCHMDKVSTETPHHPISVTGGDYKEFYLTGNLQPNTKATTDNAECYISGGRFGDVAGAAQEQLNGNVNWFIDHADIENFYGGGINDKNPITGDITTVIKNSHVNKVYCGGPKFGDMARTDVPVYITKGGNKTTLVKETTATTISANRTVSTTATDCVFGTYFGAGYGGTSLFRENKYNNYENYLEDHPWNSTVATNYDGNRGKYYTGKGILTGYDYRLFEGTRPKTVGLLFIQYASLSLASTNGVTSTLTRCTMDNFYGGGNLGKVDGNIDSKLEDCTVHGSVYGAGFSAKTPTADVFPTGGFDPIPKYSKYTGVFDEGKYPTPVKYTWSNAKNPTNGNVAIEDGLIYVSKTDKDLSALGTVTGKVTVNITGNTLVEGYVYDEDGNKTTAQEGGVFGGGDSSSVTGDTKVEIAASSQKTTGGYNAYNVFGGGNKAPVTGDSKVTLKGKSVISNNVFGGGNEAPVSGSAEVNIEE